MQRRDQANSKGLKWIIITDHAGTGDYENGADGPRLASNEWYLYINECNDAQTSYITVCPGEELATKEYEILHPKNSGHLLCYANSSYAASYGTCQELINRTNSAGGFGIIAHPYANAWVNWDDWNVTGFRGLEVISNQSDYSQSAVNKWDELLTDNLQGIINGNHPKVFGMANSDAHNTQGGWGKNMNYIYTGSSNPPGTNRSSVYDNLRAGRVTASSDGSLAVFSLNSYAPGSIVNVNQGTNNISITVSAECVESYSSPSGTIKIIKNGESVYSEPFDGSSVTMIHSFTATADCYYRVEVTFTGFVGDEPKDSYCFVNPVYVSLP